MSCMCVSSVSFLFLFLFFSCCGCGVSLHAGVERVCLVLCPLLACHQSYSAQVGYVGLCEYGRECVSAILIPGGLNGVSDPTSCYC